MESNRPTSGWAILLLKGFLGWLPLAVAVSALCLLIYVAVQQNFRQNANDPQIQMAEDAAARLEAGGQAQAVVGSAKVDIARSLAPFLIVYDDAGQVVASSAQLDGQTPDLPPGVLDAARRAGEDRISWQPQQGVRSATVIERVGGSKPGFVLAGRSLREVEERESQLTSEVFWAWLAAIVASLVTALLVALAQARLFPAGLGANWRTRNQPPLGG